ncbi:MAG: kynureninase [Alphaproteobacteria bacterium]|nr:kynureninase [Alphaproteobacteria bacterium]
MTAEPAANTRTDCERLDREDPLRAFRDRFRLPEGLIYLDGNSLGALPKAAATRVAKTLDVEWGEHLVGGWLKDGWMALSEKLGDKIAKLIGADDGEVIVVDTTSVNIHKVLAAALLMRPERRTLLTDSGNFPTDVYMAQGLAEFLERQHRVKVVGEDEVEAAIDEDTAVVFCTQINYRTGRLHDMARITAAAHAKGALAIWDVAHTAGCVPIELNKIQADFAVGCGYKYLNGGPGAPGFVFAPKRHHDKVRQPLTGWLGHANPFEFGLDYRPAPGILQWRCSSPPILGMVAMEAGIDDLIEAGIEPVRAKSLALTGLLMRLVDERLAGHGFTPATPRAPERRGSQMAFHHKNGWPIMQALIARKVIGDFREPDIVRFGIAAPYVRFVDIWDAVEHLRDVMASGAWKKPEYQVKKWVT